jgi:hypothetical protein
MICSSVNRFFMSVLCLGNGLYLSHYGPENRGQVNGTAASVTLRDLAVHTADAIAPNTRSVLRRAVHRLVRLRVLVSWATLAWFGQRAAVVGSGTRPGPFRVRMVANLTPVPDSRPRKQPNAP